MAGDGGFARLVQDGITAVLGIAQGNNRKLCPIRKEPLRAKKEKTKLFINYFEHITLTYYWLALMRQVRPVRQVRLVRQACHAGVSRHSANGATAEARRA